MLTREEQLEDLAARYGYGIAEAILDVHDGIEPELVAATDTTRLLRWSDGYEAIQTNGDPVFCGDACFDAARAELIAEAQS